MSIGAVVGLDIFTVLSLCGVIAISPLIKKVTNNWFFWIGLGGALFIYAVLVRFGHDWHVFATTAASDRGDYVKSKALLLDICPFTFIFLLTACVVDPTRRAAKIAAPFAIFGGLITILGGVEDLQNMRDACPNFAYFIFVGQSGNEMYFIMHYLMIVIGGLVFVSTPRTHLSDWIYCNGYAGIYYSYVAIIMTQMDVGMNVSGLCSYDWSIGEYNGVADFLGIVNNPIPWAPIFGFGMSYIFISLFIYLQSKLQNARKHPHYDFGWCANWTKDIKKRFLIGWYDLKPQHPFFIKKFFTVQRQTW